MIFLKRFCNWFVKQCQPKFCECGINMDDGMGQCVVCRQYISYEQAKSVIDPINKRAAGFVGGTTFRVKKTKPEEKT